jgi:hypothetical protein
VINGQAFASKAEAARYVQLKQLEKGGVIKKLNCQVPYNIVISGDVICKYVADFTYEQDGKNIVEDVKGHPTDVYKLKKKLMKAVLGISITEVRVTRRSK